MIINPRLEILSSLEIEKKIVGNITLNLFPFDNENFDSLPYPFNSWNEEFNVIRSFIPFQKGSNDHFVTIDSQWLDTDKALRREGWHIDGNFVADPELKIKSWSRISIENGEIKKDWESEHGINIPLGKYISSTKGGILCISSVAGCEVSLSSDEIEIFDGGEIKEELKNKLILNKNIIYFMSSDTPHKSLEIKKGTRRTLIRITLNHNYENKLIFNKNLNKLAA